DQLADKKQAENKGWLLQGIVELHPVVDRMASMTLEPTPAELSDGTLLERIAVRRSQDAFAQLFSRYERSLFSLSVQLTGDRNLAAEAIQNSAVDIWLSASSYRPDGNARGWIFRIVVRYSMKMVRTRRKAESQMDPK